MTKSQKYIIATHNRVYGIPNALRDYLIEKKIDTVVFIAHPLDKVSGDSFIEIYKYGKKAKQVRLKRTPELGVLNFVIDTLLTIYWTYTLLPKTDVYIGNNNLNTFSGIILKLFNKTRKTIYYSVDFSLSRFGNTFLNKIYHWIEVFCVKNSDEVWVVSKAIPIAREKFLGLSEKKYEQKIVPTGVWNHKVKAKDIKEINTHQLFFVGHIIEKQGLQIVIQAIPNIIKQIRDFKFIIVGDGDYLPVLKDMSKKLKVTDHIEFKGIVPKQEEMYDIMTSSAVGIAPYKPERDKTKNFTYFGDPGKIKDYLNASLPVIMTNVSHNAKELEKDGCAIIVPYTSNDISKAVSKIMSNINSLKKFRSNALLKAKDFDWHRIFDTALSQDLS